MHRVLDARSDGLPKVREEAMSERDNRLIGPIAAFIGARLQYPCPDVNGQGNPWTSTIRVDQHKEKFFGVVVYCSLGDRELILQKWNWCRDNKEKLSHLPRRLSPHGVKFEGDAPTPKFSAQCLFHDALHYRRCYLEMIELQPHLRGQICSRADHSELLLEQFEELNATMLQTPKAVDGLCRKYGLENAEQLMKFLHSVYEPSSKDLIGLND